MFTPGTEIGELVVREEIARGQTSRLFRAERRGPLGFRRSVVLKAGLDAETADAEVEARLLGEAARTAAVDHPCVRFVERVGFHRGRPYLVLEHVDGCSVADLLAFLRGQRRRLRPEVAVHLAVQVASALHGIHTRGGTPSLLHRSVCPSNVLLSRRGHVKLIDFGRAAGDRTPPARHRAPEERQGLEVDARADVYALGACLADMLGLGAGGRAEGRARLLDVGAVVRGDPHGGSPVCAPTLSGALRRTLARALAPDPEDRPPTARALRHDLVGAVPGALLVEDEEVAQLVREVLGARESMGLPPPMAPSPPPETQPLDPGRLQALRRQAGAPAPRRLRRDVAAALLASATLLGLATGIALGARADEAPPLHVRVGPRSPKRRAAPHTPQVSVAAPAARASPSPPSPSQMRRASRRRARPPRAEPGATAFGEEPWPVAALDELGAWEGDVAAGASGAREVTREW